MYIWRETYRIGNYEKVEELEYEDYKDAVKDFLMVQEACVYDDPEIDWEILMDLKELFMRIDYSSEDEDYYRNIYIDVCEIMEDVFDFKKSVIYEKVVLKT